MFVAPARIDVAPSIEAARPGEPPAPPPRAAIDSQAALAAILDRPLFHRDRRPAQAVAANSDLPDHYKLEGTLVFGDVRRALILNAADAAAGARWYELGDMVGAWRINSIEPGAVGLSKGDRSVTLSMEGVKETQSIISIQQRSATPIYLNDSSALSRDEMQRRRAALETFYSATTDQQLVRRE
jgi:hypothetical protein